jgi:hypothetical protein
LPLLTRLAHLVIPRRLAPRNIVGVDVIFLRPPTRTNVLSSSSPIRLTARRRMYTIVKMIVIAAAIGMWVGPRSVVIAFVAERRKHNQEGLTATASTLGLT